MTSTMPKQHYQSTAPAYHCLPQQVFNTPYNPIDVGHPYLGEQLVPPLGECSVKYIFSESAENWLPPIRYSSAIASRPTWQAAYHMPLMADRSVDEAIFQTQQPVLPPKAPSSSELMLAELKSIKDLQAKFQATLKSLETSQTECNVTLKSLETSQTEWNVTLKSLETSQTGSNVTLKKIEGDVKVLKTNMGSVFESFLRLELERSLGLEYIKPVHFKCILEMANSIAGTNPGHMTVVLDALWPQLPETLNKLCDFLGVSDRNAFDFQRCLR